MVRPDSPEDREVLAGEYVLGTLDPGERAEAERLRASDPDFASAIAAWEHRLDPLNAAVESVAPPEGLLQRIEQRLGETAVPAAAPSATIIKLERRVRHWRAATLAMAAVAASLIGFIVAGRASRSPIASWQRSSRATSSPFSWWRSIPPRASSPSARWRRGHQIRP